MYTLDTVITSTKSSTLYPEWVLPAVAEEDEDREEAWVMFRRKEASAMP